MAEPSLYVAIINTVIFSPLSVQRRVYVQVLIICNVLFRWQKKKKQNEEKKKNENKIRFS